MLKPNKSQEDIQLEQINNNMRSLLRDDEERIIHRPILIYKVKPDKGTFAMMYAHWRYLMFTNKHVYNMDPKVYDNGGKKNLVKSKIDIHLISHLIFAP